MTTTVRESMHSVDHFREYLHRADASIIEVDVACIGGITPWLKWRNWPRREPRH